MPSSLSRIKRVFTHNWNLKVLAIFTAILSFYAIRGLTRYEVEHEVAIEVKVAKKGIAILEQNPMTSRIRFRGSQEDLLRLDQHQLRVVVNAKADDPDGSETVGMRPRDVDGASGVSVVRIDPSNVELTFDREIERTIEVAKPTTTGTPLIGNVEVDFEPKTVRITGPHSALANVVMVNTEPIDVEGRGASFSKRVRVVLPGDTGITRVDPPRIDVKVNIVTETMTRGLTNVTVLAVVQRGMPCDLTFSPKTVDVFLQGRAEVLDSIPDKAVKVFVDCIDGHESSTNVLPVNVHLPPGLDVNATVEPKAVRVVMRKQSAEPEPKETEGAGATAGEKKPPAGAETRPRPEVAGDEH